MERVCPWYIFTTSNRAEGLRNLPPASVLASIYWVDLHQWPCLLDIFHAREFKKYTSSSGSVAEELRHDLFKNFPKLVKLFQDSHDRVESLDVAFRQLQSGLACPPVCRIRVCPSWACTCTCKTFDDMGSPADWLVSTKVSHCDEVRFWRARAELMFFLDTLLDRLQVYDV